MIRMIDGFLKRLKNCRSGNATMLVAMGLPMLIGGTGFAVDTAQWYMWKRELQFATDQAAIAAAWALTDEDTADTYDTRGQQEYANNLAATADHASAPSFQLANFGGGSNNSVIVTANLTRSLPFSSILTGSATTISVFAQAQFEAGAEFSSCLIAVDEDADGAITIGGSSVLTAGCGMSALSDSPDAIVVTGNPTVQIGLVMAAGGVDDWFDDTEGNTVIENYEGLYDKYADLDPPDNPTPRTYSCPTGNTTTSTVADVTTTTATTYEYFIGPSRNNSTPYNYAGAKPDGYSSSGPTEMTVPDGTVAGTQTQTDTPTWFNIAGSGDSKVFEKTTTTNTITYANVRVVPATSVASVLPGTYTDMNLSCDSVFTGGIYVIDGGTLTINAQYDVTGAGVMFVLKNGAGFHINGGADINLTALTISELLALGFTAERAEELAGMLIFEDRNSEGYTQGGGNTINGNAETVLNGTIYLPSSHLQFSGTATVTSQCLNISAATITLTGDTEMTSFCPSGVSTNTTVASSGSIVRLVA